MVTLFIKSVNDSKDDFFYLFQLYETVLHEHRQVCLNFSHCSFLKQNAVALLGGMIRTWLYYDIDVTVDIDSIPRTIQNFLSRNFFLVKMFPSLFSAPANVRGSIPYREDIDYSPEVGRYLLDQWLGRGWIGVSTQLKSSIVSNVMEIYLNAFEHASSNVGVFSCGQYYPNTKNLELTIVDFGYGIPSNVSSFFGNPIQSSDASSLLWAFEEGNSTRLTGMPGGLGLHLLKEFIVSNSGKMDIYSNQGHLTLRGGNKTFESTPVGFKGTVITITLRCDHKFYYLKDEIF